MKMLFDDGEILIVAKEWLESPAQTKMANASLMIANFARSGKCIYTCTYVSTNIHVTLGIIID